MEDTPWKGSLDQVATMPRAVSLRRKVALAILLIVAGFLSLGRGALLYGWTQGTLASGVVTIPVGVFLYLFMVRRWSQRGY